jgi:serine/threonine protein phosphatase 1
MTNVRRQLGDKEQTGSNPGSDTYAIGDLHGEITLLRRLLDRLAPARRDTLIFLGDYLDRGEDAVQTVETLLALPSSMHCIFLQGNHDAAWLETWDGSAFTRCPHIAGANRVWEQCQGTIPPRIGQFLTKTRPYHEDGYAWYSHAGATPGVPFWQSSPESYVWGDAEFLGSTYDWGKPSSLGTMSSQIHS